jgi:hypothetical protein
MSGAIRLALIASLVAVLPEARVFAQIPPPPPVPVQDTQPAPTPVPQPLNPVPVVPGDPRTTDPIPPIQVPSSVAPSGGPVPPPDAVFGNPGAPLPPPGAPNHCIMTPGLYGLLELSVLWPQIHGTLAGSATVLGFNDTFSVTNPPLEATGSPRIEIGYRLGDGLGAVAFSYRSIVSSGGFNVANWDALGAGFESTRLNMNVFDLDYVSPAYDLGSHWELAWCAGVRIAAVYFDDQVTGGFDSVHLSNNFVGAGPHACVEASRAIEIIPGLAATGKLDGGVVIGEISQSSSETVDFGPGAIFGGANHFHETQTAPMLMLQLGLSYTPPGWVSWARFGFGYQFEYWWDVGTAGPSHNDFFSNGIYFRGEINF